MLTDYQIVLVEKSFQSLSGNGEAFIDMFYQNMFRLEPGTKKLFKTTNWKRQRQKMLLMLVLIVDNLRDMPHIRNMITETQRVHNKLSIHPQYYNVMIDAMLETFATLSPESWSSEVEAAWRAAFEQIVQIFTDENGSLT